MSPFSLSVKRLLINYRYFPSTQRLLARLLPVKWASKREECLDGEFYATEGELLALWYSEYLSEEEYRLALLGEIILDGLCKILVQIQRKSD